MARLGKLPVELPQEVKAEIEANKVKIIGPMGTLERDFPKELRIRIKKNTLVVEKKGESKSANALQGTLRAHLLNMIKGVNKGWSKNLEIVGAGYRVEVKGNQLVFMIGYSHPVIVEAPEGIKFTVSKSIISVEGIDRELVGQVAARIKAVRKPDSYKGKGIRYQGEEIRLKPGKAVAKIQEPGE